MLDDAANCSRLCQSEKQCDLAGTVVHLTYIYIPAAGGGGPGTPFSGSGAW
jgi:hypothetical protein